MSAKPISSTPIRFEHVGDGVLKRVEDAPIEQLIGANYTVVVEFLTTSGVGHRQWKPLADSNLTSIEAVMSALAMVKGYHPTMTEIKSITIERDAK